MTKLSAVVPVYNEQLCIDELYDRLSAVLAKVADDCEIVFIDDGSVDSTWKLISELAKRDGKVVSIRFSRNFGHHYAITAGLDHCSGDWVVIMDADLQDAPEEIPRLYEKALSSSADIVLAKRKSKKHGKIKQFLSVAFYAFLSKISDIRFDPEVGVFRLVSRRAVREMCKLRENSRFFPGVSQWVGFKTEYVDVEHRARFAGETKYPLSRQISLAANATLSFTDKPLKIAVYIGLLFSLLGAVHGASIIIRALMGQIAVMGYASLMSAILFVGGVTISTVGLTGLYVGRIFREVKNRPLYVIETLVSNQNVCKSIDEGGL